MHKINVRDIIGGGVLIAFGALSALMSAGYGVGTVRSMGPGFFPLALSVLLLVLGLGILIPGFVRSGTRIDIQWRNVIVVTVAILFFGTTLTTLGALPTVFLTILIVSTVSTMTLRQTAITGVVMAAAIWLVFVLGLGMTIPLTPWSY